MSSIKNTKQMVEEVLRKEPHTRNSDVALTIAIWEMYYPSRLKRREADGRLYVAVDDLFELPREDNIKRIRAKLQNEELKYPPTDKTVAEKRYKNMQKWHKAMALNKY